MSNYNAGINYAEDVVSGKIVAGKYVRLSCQRFLDDLKRTDWRWKFDIKRANHVIQFMEQGINHVTGPLAGTLLKLEPWQIFVLSNIYGWVDEEETRRFQYVILEIARKNGKSLFASAMAVYDLLFGEEGGQVYSLATKRDQAKIAWEAAYQMIQKAPKKVKDRFVTTKIAIANESKWSKYVALGRDSKSLDGLNPTLNIFDEAAAYSDRNLVEVMTSATGARKTFLHLFITTAQFDKQTIYYENRQYLQGLLEGKFDDDRWFGTIYTLDDDDDWLDEDVWIKANPNLGVSITLDYLRGEVKQAQEMKAKRNSVLVKHFNRWVSSSEAWVDINYWTDPDVIVDEVTREGKCYIGYDLAQTRDLCAVTRLWVDNGEISVDFKAFLPEIAMQNAPIHVQPIYRMAHEAGVLVFTPSEITDYDFIQSYIEQSCKDYDVEAIAYDPYNAQQLVTNLEKAGLENKLLEVRQGIAQLSPAAKETERLIVGKRIKHVADPFIDWQLENCTIYLDPNENIKVKKGDDTTLKIDSIIALIMCIALAADKLEKAPDFNFAFVEYN